MQLYLSLKKIPSCLTLSKAFENLEYLKNTFAEKKCRRTNFYIS